MSHATRRLARLAAGVAVAAGATATTLLGAAPAHAQTESTTASMSVGILKVTGTSSGSNIIATGDRSAVLLSDSQTAITAVGPGCTQLGARVRCTTVGAIHFSGLGGSDGFRNKTSVPSSLRGGTGLDTLFGGSGNDSLIGNEDSDVARGGNGNDLCNAESEVECEQ